MEAEGGREGKGKMRKNGGGGEEAQRGAWGWRNKKVGKGKSTKKPMLDRLPQNTLGHE